ncbi:MAG: DUF1844 domain-containing protein [Acidobacteriaceae bacterium]
MAEKEPQFTVTDRRKFTKEGEVRPEVVQEEAERSASAPAAPAAEASASGIHVVPPANGAAAQPVAPPAAEEQEAVLQPPTAEESAESSAAYAETTRQMDDILRKKMPQEMKNQVVGMEHIIQSLYMSAAMALGAGTPQGEKARIDLMGARQAIDMMEVLGKKTAGNLTENEKRILESALFEARMMFLEVTQAIARNATQPTPPQGKH